MKRYQLLSCDALLYKVRLLEDLGPRQVSATTNLPPRALVLLLLQSMLWTDQYGVVYAAS